METRKINFKRTATAFLAVLMAMLFALDTPVKVLAASADTFSLDDYTPQELEEKIDNGTLNAGKPLYICDLMLASGDSKEEAKKALHDAGYIAYDANLMEDAGTDSPASTQHYTYLGYKLTDKKEEGITGISAMDQEGGYKEFDYREFLQKGLPGLGDLVSGMQAICKEFKTRYDAGEEAAIVAKRRLDLFCVPKTSAETTGTPLGDYLLDPKREYKDLEDMILVLNGLVLNIINDELSMAISDSSLDETQAYKGYTHNTTWLTDAVGKVAASTNLSTIDVANNLFWTDLENRLGKEAKAMKASYIQDANDTAKNYLSTLSINLTIGGKTYGTVKSFIENAPIRALALFVSFLPEICLEGRFADILNRFAAAPDDGIPSGFYTSSQAVVSYVSLVEDKDWIKRAYNTAQNNPKLASIEVANSEYWLDLQRKYAAELTVVQTAMEDGTLSDEAVEYLKATTLGSTNAYDFLDNCSKRMGCAFFEALADASSTTACALDRYFIDMLEVCASDYKNRIPTQFNLEPHYTSEWADNILKSINANPYNSTTEKTLLDKAKNLTSEIDTFRASLKTYIADYTAAKTQMEKSGSIGIDLLTPEQNNKLMNDVLEGNKDVSETKMPDLYYVSTANLIDKYELYDGSSLLDYFIQINDAFAKGDNNKGYALAYPVISALTEGQRYVYKTRSFMTFLMLMQTAEFEIELVSQAYDYEKDLLSQGFGEGKVSIWYGTNKDLLEPTEFLAITNDDVRRAAANDSLKELWDNPPAHKLCNQILTTVSQVLAGVVGLALVVIQVAAQVAGIGMFVLIKSACLAVFTTAAIGTGVTATGTAAVVACTLSTVMVGLVVVVIAVLIAVAIAYLIIYLVEYYHTSYTKKPTILLDCQTTGGQNSQIIEDSIVKYYVVRGPDGKAADANAEHGKKWNALYYTKDTRLGSPITEGPNGQFFYDNMGGIVKQSDARPLAKFGEDSPFNINTNCFNYDAEKGHYFWYYTEESMNQDEDDSETASKTYIKDIILTYSKDATEAKKAIERLSGYKVYDEDLSPHNEKDFHTYLGYKTTDNPALALTDIRVSYASASPQIMYGGAEYHNIQPTDLQTVPTKTCSEASWKRDDTNFSYGVYASNSTLVGDPILADSLEVVTSYNKVPEGKEVVSMFCGGAFDFDSWDHEDEDTFGNHKFITYKTETTTTDTETYIAGFAFMSGTKDWPGGKNAEPNMEAYAKSLGYTVLDWWDPSVGYVYDSDVTHLMYITTHNPKRAITDIGVFTSEPKSPYLPDAIGTAMGGYCVCQIYTQGDFTYYGTDGGGSERCMRSSHAYLTDLQKTEINHYTTNGEYPNDHAYIDDPWGKALSYQPSVLRALPRGLYVAGPVEGKRPLRLEDVIFSKTKNTLPTDGKSNANFFYLTGDGSKTKTCENNIGTGWKSAHPLDQYYYDTYDAKGNITSSFNLSDDSDSRRLYIFYKDGTPNRVRGNYVSNVEIVGDQTKNSSYNTARLYAMAYGTDILNLNEPIRLFSDEFWDPTTDKLFYSAKDFIMIKYYDGCIYVTVTYTNDPSQALGSIRILQEDENEGRLAGTYKMPLENSDTNAIYDRGQVVAPFFPPKEEDEDEDDDEPKGTIGSSIGKKSETQATTGIVAYKTMDGFKTNRLSVRSIPIAAAVESNGGTANTLGRAEYYLPYYNTSEPFFLANYRIGKAFCLCAERTDETGLSSIDANFKYIESLTVITDKTYDGTVGMAATTLGADKYPFVINCDITSGSLRSGNNRVVAIGVKRTGNEKEAIKDIKLTVADLGEVYEYLGRNYTRVNKETVNGMYIYTTKDDGSKDLLGDYIDWHTVNVETTNFKNFDFTKLNWNTAGADFNNNLLPLKDSEMMAKINEVKKYQAQIAKYFSPELSAITNIGFIPAEGDKNIYWAGRAAVKDANTINPVTADTVVLNVTTYDGTPSALKLVYTNGANKNYDDFITENKKNLASLYGSIFTDFNQIWVVITLSAIALAAIAVALVVGLKRRRKMH